MRNDRRNSRPHESVLPSPGRASEQPSPGSDDDRLDEHGAGEDLPDGAETDDDREIDWESVDIVEVWRRLHGFGTPRWEAHLEAVGAATPEYHEWLAREARARQTPEERAETQRQAARFAQRLTANWAMRGLATRLRVRTRPGRGSTRSESRELAAEQALAVGARTRAAPIIELGAAAGGGRALWDEPVTRYVELPDDVPSGKYLALQVSGDSMEPLMHDGDRVLVKLGGAARKDTVIVARLPDDGYVIKRVGRLEPDAIELVSLNPAYAPFWIARDEAPVLGQVVVRWCDHDVE